MKPNRWQAVRDRFLLWTSLLLLGFLCLLWAPCAWLLQRALPCEITCRVGRAAATGFFRFYLRVLVWMGAARFDLTELDALRNAGPLIVAPNHPSLLDALLIISRLPQIGCVMKADLFESMFLSAGARLARYISNDSLRCMIRQSVNNLASGQSLLLFPEGTRTSEAPVGPFQRAVCVIGRAAKVPVQTVFIETDSPYLTKGWTLFHKPPLPITYRVRLGRAFEIGDDDARFLDELHQYFSDELGASRRAAVAPALGSRSMARQTGSPVQEIRPPAREIRPPVQEIRPPAREIRPPAREIRPPAREIRPPAPEIRPPVQEIRPPAPEIRPPAHEPRPSPHNSRVPASGHAASSSLAAAQPIARTRKPHADDGPARPL